MRIVSLLPSATEILFAIGAGDDVVAVTHECDFPEAAPALPAITSSVFDQEGTSCADIDRHIMVFTVCRPMNGLWILRDCMGAKSRSADATVGCRTAAKHHGKARTAPDEHGRDSAE
jgi:hypothetical protein